jgi:hypothetical protein
VIAAAACSSIAFGIGHVHDYLAAWLLQLEYFPFCLLGLITNSVALIRERTILTERPPLVGEVSANVCR